MHDAGTGQWWSKDVCFLKHCHQKAISANPDDREFSTRPTFLRLAALLAKKKKKKKKCPTAFQRSKTFRLHIAKGERQSRGRFVFPTYTECPRFFWETLVYAVKRGRYLVFSRAYDENVIFLLLGSFRFSTYLASILFFFSFLVVLVKIYICINIRGLPRTIECICRKFDEEKTGAFGMRNAYTRALGCRWKWSFSAMRCIVWNLELCILNMVHVFWDIDVVRWRCYSWLREAKCW